MGEEGREKERERERESNNAWRRRDEKDGRTRGEGSMPVARATTAPDLHPSWTILLSPAPFTRTNWDEVSSRIPGLISKGYIVFRLKPKRGNVERQPYPIELSNLDLMYILF